MDFAIPPIDGEYVEAALPLPPTQRTRVNRVDTPLPAQAVVAPLANDELLSDATERTQLTTKGPTEPHSMEVRATVHDAAAHGNPIAAAIERAEQTAHDAEIARLARHPSASEIDPNAQMLGGAAASAASGQAAVIRREPRSPDPIDVRPATLHDPLARVDAGSDDNQRQRRNELSQEMLERDSKWGDEEDLPGEA